MAMLTPATVHALLDAHGLHPKRSLGQNFLVDPNTARRVVALADLSPRTRRCSRSVPVSVRSRWRCSTPATTSWRSSSTTGWPRCCERCSSTPRPTRRRTAVPRPRPGRSSATPPPSISTPCSAPTPGSWACVSNLPYNVAVPVVMRLLETGPAGRPHPGDGAAGGGGAPGRRARRRAVRRGLGEGRLLRRGPGGGPGARRRSSCPGPRSTRRWCGSHRRAEPPVSVPSADDLFALVRAGFAQRRKMLRRSLLPVLGARTPEVLTAGGHRAHRPGRGARARAVGGPGPQRGDRGGCVRLARVRATAYPKLNLSLRVLGRRPDGYHDLESLVISLGQPHDVLEAYAVPAPGGVQLEVGGVEVGEDVPSDHRNLAFIAAEKLLVRAGRSGHGVRLVLRKHIPAGGGLGGGSADAAAALLAVRELHRRRHRRRRGDVHRRRGRFRRAVLRAAAARPGCAGGARSSSRCRWRPGSRSWSRSRRSACRRRTCTGRGTSSAAPARSASCPRPRRLSHIIPELVNDLEPAAEALEPRMREFRAAFESRDRRARAARGQRIGVRRADRRRRDDCRVSSIRSGGGCGSRWWGPRACREECDSPAELGSSAATGPDRG